MFAEMDVDGSGAIDAAELRVLMQRLGKYLTARELELAVQSIDKDGSVRELASPHRSPSPSLGDHAV
jgi:Ca2+-binding EF-hand superfamily protein